MSEHGSIDAGSFWRRVNDRVTNLGHDQLWLAGALDVAQSTLSTWMKAGRYPRADRAHRIASILGVSVSWLVTGNDTDPLISDPLIRSMYELALRLNRPDLERVVYLMGRLVRSSTAVEIRMPERRIDNDE